MFGLLLFGGADAVQGLVVACAL